MNPPALPAGARGLWLRRLALASVLLMAVVVVCSAWLRLAQERLVCTSWPACRGTPVEAARAPAAAPWLGDPAVLAGARIAHRIAASAMLPAALALAWLALARRPRDAAAGTRALAMLALALALAALGIVTPGSRSAAVLLGNQLGGLLLLGLAWSTRRGLSATVGPTPATARWARLLALLWLLQAALGALSGAGSSGDGAALAHLALAAPAVLGAFALGVFGWRRRHADALALALAATAQVLLGVAAMLSAAPPALVLLHNAVAALGLALLIGFGLARQARGVARSAAPGPHPVHH